MPSRYRFDLENGPDVIRDEEGALADSLDHAIEQALEGVKELRRDGELSPSMKDWDLVVRDDAGVELERIALKVRLPVLFGAN